MNLGVLKENAFTYLLTENNKPFFKEFIKQINISKPLKREYLAVNAIENARFENYKSAEDFLLETINLLKDVKKRDHLKELSELFKKYKLTIKENVKNKTLYEALDRLIYLWGTKKTPLNIRKAYEAKELIINHLLTKQQELKEEKTTTYDFQDVPNKVLTKVAVEKYNNKWANKLNENEINILKAEIANNQELKEKIFTEIKEGNIDKVRDKLVEIDETDKDLYQKLRSTEKKLLKMVFNEETFLDDACKLVELNESLDDGNDDE